MDNKRNKTIAITIVVAMVLVFLGLITYISLRNIVRSSDAVKDTGETGLYEIEETTLEDELASDMSFETVDVSKQIFTIDDIDPELDDTAVHEIEEESVYVNTIDLLPSVYQERSKISKEKIQTKGFPDSYAITTQKTMKLGDATLSIPQEVYLYNCGMEKSSSLTVAMNIEGDSSAIKSIGWASSDSTKVEVSASAGERVTISSVDPEFSGSVPVTIIVTYAPEPKRTSTEEFTLDVVVEEINYGDDELKDYEGNTLYIDKAGTQVAHVSDFGKNDYFFGPVTTTGWQNIDGKTYYFDSNSWAVTGRQIIGGMPYEFNENGVLMSSTLEMGIDVSKYQKDIDWEQVAASGISFAIVRCGFRGSSTGKLVEDPYFRKNMEGATANGIQVGVYFFTQAITEREAIEEASMAIAMCRGYNVTLPIYIDSENAVNGRANGLDRTTRTKCLKAFCETINNAGYVGGVYASKSWYYHKVYAEALEQYNIWVAQYNTECNYTGKTDFWQYSSKETIAGIVGYVDVDVVRRRERSE